MVLDNARIHHANLPSSFLEQNKDRLELVFLPPYSPELNPIEGLWKWLTSTIINNVYYYSISKTSVAVKNFVKYINEFPQTVIDRLCLV